MVSEEAIEIKTNTNAITIQNQISNDETFSYQ